MMRLVGAVWIVDDELARIGSWISLCVNVCKEEMASWRIGIVGASASQDFHGLALASWRRVWAPVQLHWIFLVGFGICF